MKAADKFPAGFVLDTFWKKMWKNVLTIVTGTGISHVLTMFTTVFILLILTPEEYGAFIIGQNYMGIVDTLFNFQSWQGVIRYGSLAIEEKKEKTLFATIKAGLFMDLITCIAGLFAGILLVELVGKIMGWSDLALLICKIFCLEIIFHIEGSITGVFRLFDLFKYHAIGTVAASLIKFAAVLLMYGLHNCDPVLFTYIYVITDIAKYMVILGSGMMVLHIRCGLRNIIFADWRDLDQKFWSYTIWSNLAATADVPIKYFDICFLSIISEEIVAGYHFYKKMFALFGMLVTPISQAIMPQLSELIAQARRKEAYWKTIKLRNFIFSVLLPFFIAFVLICPFALRAIGLEYYTGSIYSLYGLAVYYLWAFCNTGIHPLFSAYGFSKESTLITFGTNILYVCICLFFIHRLQVSAIIMASFFQAVMAVELKKGIIKKNLGIRKFVAKD